MNTQQNIKATHWGFNFGNLAPNINTDNARIIVEPLPKNKKSKPRSKNRFYPIKKKRIAIKTQIAVMLMMLRSRKSTRQMYNALLKKGLLTDHKNAVFQFSGFEAIASEVRNQIFPERKTRRQAAAELFDQGKTRAEIQETLNATRVQIYEALVRTGRIIPSKL